MCLSVYVCQLLCKNGRTDPNAVRVIDYNELYLFDGVHMMDATCRIRLNDTCRRRRRRAGCRYRRFYSVLLAIIKLSLTYRAKFGFNIANVVDAAGRPALQATTDAKSAGSLWKCVSVRRRKCHVTVVNPQRH